MMKMMSGWMVVLAISAAACTGGDDRRTSGAAPRAANAQTPSATVTTQAGAIVPSAEAAPLSADEKAVYRDMAAGAWKYMKANYQPATGLVSATPEWANTTMWDVGGQILGFYAAKEIGLITRDAYDARTQKLLATLEKLSLYDNTALSKLYSTITGVRSKESRIGWTAT